MPPARRCPAPCPAGGAFLCPPQSKLQEAYKSELGSAYGITFSRLLALNNMPIKRFADWLARAGKMEEYMQLLVGAFNPAAGESLMCRCGRGGEAAMGGQPRLRQYYTQLARWIAAPACVIRDVAIGELKVQRCAEGGGQAFGA